MSVAPILQLSFLEKSYSGEKKYKKIKKTSKLNSYDDINTAIRKAMSREWCRWTIKHSYDGGKAFPLFVSVLEEVAELVVSELTRISQLMHVKFEKLSMSFDLIWVNCKV